MALWESNYRLSALHRVGDCPGVNFTAMTTTIPKNNVPHQDALEELDLSVVEWTCPVHEARVESPCRHPTKKGKPCKWSPAKLRKQAAKFLQMADGHVAGAQVFTDPDPSGRTPYKKLKAILWNALPDSGGGRRECPKCKRSKYQDDFELDHIEPLSKGGTDEDSNIQIICGPCNRKKGNLPESTAFPDSLPGFSGAWYG